MTKLKAFAEDKLNIAKKTISLFAKVENNVGTLFSQGFPKPSSLSLVKVRIKRDNLTPNNKILD